ncbi:iron-containing alcohol dehydrogenase [Patescibacteria group bacterium]|nr:iron-containing alcohol dehydrogenase [Patescibacteria group bacterium]
MKNFEFYLPTKINFGPGVIEKVGEEAKLLGKRAFVVTGKKSARKMGFLERLEKSLRKKGVIPIFFEKIEPNPSNQTVEEGVNLAKKEKCDLIIGLGGGSSLDAAKVISLLLTNPFPLSQYFGKNKVKFPLLPLIAIPTTAGAGSEVTPYAVITHIKDGSHQKKIIADVHLFPIKTLVDPELTLSLPFSITSDTGIDALSHAVESYTSNRSHSLSEMIALRSVKLLGKHLPEVIDNPEDIEERGKVLYASMLAGIAIAQTGTTLMHAMGYRLTSDLNLPHGRANGLLLPWFWELNFPGNFEKFANLTKSLGGDIEGLTVRKAAQGGIKVVKEFLFGVGLPKLNLGEVKEKTIVEFAKEVMQNKAKLANNPRQVSLKDIIKVYKKALWGAR